MTPEEGRELVRTGLARVGVRLTDETASIIADTGFAIPQVLQYACQEVCTQLDRQITAGGDNRVGERLVQNVVAQIESYLFETLLTQMQGDGRLSDSVVQARRCALFGLVAREKSTFSPAVLRAAFQKYGGHHATIEQVTEWVSPLLQTLVLARNADHYRFAGPTARPYLPTLAQTTTGQRWLDQELSECSAPTPSAPSAPPLKEEHR